MAHRGVAIVDADASVVAAAGGGLSSIDLAGAARLFFRRWPDSFDLLVVGADFATTADRGALYQPVASLASGIGGAPGAPASFDHRSRYGSRRLDGVVFLGGIADLPADPHAAWRDGSAALDVLAQEVGHRGGPMVRFRDADGLPSSALLGAHGTHWSFFADTGGSPLGGNRWEADGDGRWRTAAPRHDFCSLGLYLLGLLPAEQAPTLRYLADPVVLRPGRDRLGRPWSARSPPQADVVARGSWREVALDSVVAVEGPRRPAAADPLLRMAFVLLVWPGSAPSQEGLAALQALAAAWPAHYARVTGRRGRSAVALPD